MCFRESQCRTLHDQRRVRVDIHQALHQLLRILQKQPSARIAGIQ